MRMTARFMAAVPPVGVEGYSEDDATREARVMATTAIEAAKEHGMMLALVGDVAGIADSVLAAAVAAMLEDVGIDPGTFDPDDPVMVDAAERAAREAGLHWSQYLRDILPMLYVGHVGVMNQ